MGDMADDAFDAWLQNQASVETADLEPYEWMDAEGNVIDMHDMSTTYLGNCLSICERTGNTEKAQEIMDVLRDRMGVSS